MYRILAAFAHDMLHLLFIIYLYVCLFAFSLPITVNRRLIFKAGYLRYYYLDNPGLSAIRENRKKTYFAG